MKILFYFAVVALTNAATNGTNCTSEMIHDDLDVPFHLTIDSKTNTLFFSYAVRGGIDMFAVAFIDLATNSYGNISGISEGFASAIDRKNNVVYLGNNVGIYKFDYETSEAHHAGANMDHSIWQMYFKDTLYYTTLKPSEKLFTFKDGVSKAVDKFKDTKVKLIAFDDKDNMFIYNDTGLFSYAGDNVVSYNGVYEVSAFAKRHDGKMYFSSISAPQGIFHINPENKTIALLADIEDVNGFAFKDNGDIIYANDDGILLLKKEDKCLTYS